MQNGAAFWRLRFVISLKNKKSNFCEFCQLHILAILWYNMDSDVFGFSVTHTHQGGQKYV
jgi:hypothetical protein